MSKLTIKDFNLKKEFILSKQQSNAILGGAENTNKPPQRVGYDLMTAKAC